MLWSYRLALVVAVARNHDDQIAEVFCTVNEVDVTWVEEAVGAVGDDFGHKIDIK